MFSHVWHKACVLHRWPDKDCPAHSDTNSTRNCLRTPKRVEDLLGWALIYVVQNDQGMVQLLALPWVLALKPGERFYRLDTRNNVAKHELKEDVATPQLCQKIEWFKTTTLGKPFPWWELAPWALQFSMRCAQMVSRATCLRKALFACIHDFALSKTCVEHTLEHCPEEERKVSIATTLPAAASAVPRA